MSHLVIVSYDIFFLPRHQNGAEMAVPTITPSKVGWGVLLTLNHVVFHPLEFQQARVGVQLRFAPNIWH